MNNIIEALETAAAQADESDTRTIPISAEFLRGLASALKRDAAEARESIVDGITRGMRATHVTVGNFKDLTSFGIPPTIAEDWSDPSMDVYNE